ncbi:hypothetical protein FORC066_1023 [Yersinia enterocolitica]|nr:hypothetical protein FORC066_1023 [Yersinia enterocolitica]
MIGYLDNNKLKLLISLNVKERLFFNKRDIVISIITYLLYLIY